jgi:MFS family permease
MAVPIAYHPILKHPPPSLRQPHIRYLCVYLLATFGDWLQGPYFYDAYAEYGFTRPQIQALFVVGFGASGIGGTVVGSLADTFGRKRFAVVYFLLYAAACLLLHVRVIEVLFLGRVLSGIATSLLFSVFESWVVCRHAQRGFPPELLGDTFKWAGLFNGLSAIAAGATAQV